MEQNNKEIPNKLKIMDKISGYSLFVFPFLLVLAPSVFSGDYTTILHNISLFLLLYFPLVPLISHAYAIRIRIKKGLPIGSSIASLFLFFVLVAIYYMCLGGLGAVIN